MTTRLAYRDGWLCAAEEIINYFEPKIDMLYWPLLQAFRSRWKADLGKELHYDKRLYIYKLKIGSFWEMFPLSQGAQTKTLAVEHQEVPKPKVCKGTEIRWYCGHWEKYSLKKEWILA